MVEAYSSSVKLMKPGGGVDDGTSPVGDDEPDGAGMLALSNMETVAQFG